MDKSGPRWTKIRQWISNLEEKWGKLLKKLVTKIDPLTKRKCTPILFKSRRKKHEQNCKKYAMQSLFQTASKNPQRKRFCCLVPSETFIMQIFHQKKVWKAYDSFGIHSFLMLFACQNKVHGNFGKVPCLLLVPSFDVDLFLFWFSYFWGVAAWKMIEKMSKIITKIPFYTSTFP